MKRLLLLSVVVLGLMGCTGQAKTFSDVEQLVDAGDYEQALQLLANQELEIQPIQVDLQVAINNRLQELWWVDNFHSEQGITDEIALGLQAYQHISSDIQGPFFNNHYFIYSKEQFDQHTNAYFNTTLNPDDYTYVENSEQLQPVIYDDGEYYVVAADYPGTVGMNLREVNSLTEVGEDLYIADYTDMYFDAFTYEQETKYPFDYKTYSSTQTVYWPDDTQYYIKPISTGTALLTKNKHGIALLYMKSNE